MLMGWPAQALQEEVDQHKLTIQQLQEQLQAITALKQQTSTAAEQSLPQQTGAHDTEASAEDSAGAASAADDAKAAAADVGAEEGKGRTVAIIGGEQVRAWPTPLSHALQLQGVLTTAGSFLYAQALLLLQL